MTWPEGSIQWAKDNMEQAAKQALDLMEKTFGSRDLSFPSVTLTMWKAANGDLDEWDAFRNWRSEVGAMSEWLEEGAFFVADAPIYSTSDIENQGQHVMFT